MRLTATPCGGALWSAIDALIDRAPTDDDLRAHRLEVLAARRFRMVGRAVPPDFVAHERLAGIAALTAPAVLARVRAAYEGPAIVLKGPEVAARYPDPALRAYGDIDLLVPDAQSTHRALLAAGFKLVGDPALYVDLHHLRPVATNGLPIHVEIHSRPKWLAGVEAPPTEALFECAQPSSTLAGMLALPPSHETLLLAVHSWAHEPLRRLRDMIDVAAVVETVDRPEIARLARAWNVAKLWTTTIDTVDSLFANAPTPWALRLWAQNLPRVRERTVLENHLERWLSNFSALSPLAAASTLPRTFLDEVRREKHEDWREKLTRTTFALRNISYRRSRHLRALDERLERSGDSGKKRASSLP